MNLTAIAIFAVTYVLISARRLSWLRFDRPAGALLGAVACVAAGVLAPAEALAAVDGKTILLLLGVMGMGAFLAEDGFFSDLERSLATVARTPLRLLGYIVWGSGVLSAFITNDAVCLLGAPLVVRLIQRHRLPALPFLLALATSANTGSVATLVGNPQNMLCGVLGHLSYREHLLLVGPIAVIGLVINHAVLFALYRRSLLTLRLEQGAPHRAVNARSGVTLAVIACTAVTYMFGLDLAWASAGGFTVLMLLRRVDTRKLWSRIDWSILLFFAGLFVVVEGFLKSGAPALLFERFPLAQGEGELLGSLRLAGVFLVGSNIVSNVPFILVVRDQMATLQDSRAAWELLAMASTFAGNLTLLGSVANIIVAENAREVGGMGFWQHLKVGLPVAVSTTLAGVLWIALCGI